MKVCQTLLTGCSHFDESYSGLRVARLKVVFKIPKAMEAVTFGENITPPEHLAYVEWFTRPRTCDTNSGMYQISYSRMANGERESSIIEVSTIARTAHLLPNFGHKANTRWTSETVLDDCDRFMIGNRNDQLAFQTLY